MYVTPFYHQQQATAATTMPCNHHYEYSMVASGVVHPESNHAAAAAGAEPTPSFSHGEYGRAVGEPTSSSWAASSSSSQHSHQTWTPPAETEVVGPEALCPDEDEEAMVLAPRQPGRPLSEQWGQEATMTPFTGPGTPYHFNPYNGNVMGSPFALDFDWWNYQQAQANNWWPGNPAQQHRPPTQRNRHPPPANQGSKKNNTKRG